MKMIQLHTKHQIVPFVYAQVQSHGPILRERPKSIHICMKSAQIEVLVIEKVGDANAKMVLQELPAREVHVSTTVVEEVFAFQSKKHQRAIHQTKLH